MTDTNTLEPSDAEILALNAGEVHFSESPSKYPAAGFGTQYHAGAPGVLSFARAVLAAKWGAPALASSEPVERQPLTDEQIEALPAWSHFVGLWPENRKEIARAIEAAHGITLKQGETA